VDLLQECRSGSSNPQISRHNFTLAMTLLRCAATYVGAAGLRIGLPSGAIVAGPRDARRNAA